MKKLLSLISIVAVLSLASCGTGGSEKGKDTSNVITSSQQSQVSSEDTPKITGVVGIQNIVDVSGSVLLDNGLGIYSTGRCPYCNSVVDVLVTISKSELKKSTSTQVASCSNCYKAFDVTYQIISE